MKSLPLCRLNRRRRSFLAQKQARGMVPAGKPRPPVTGKRGKGIGSSAHSSLSLVGSKGGGGVTQSPRSVGRKRTGASRLWRSSMSTVPDANSSSFFPPTNTLTCKESYNGSFVTPPHTVSGMGISNSSYLPTNRIVTSQLSKPIRDL